MLLLSNVLLLRTCSLKKCTILFAHRVAMIHFARKCCIHLWLFRGKLPSCRVDLASMWKYLLP